jgi:hypothetical protein
MVTFSAHEDMPIPQVENEPHQHAFILLGEKQLFGVHMTQYHCELHKYQIILKISLPDKIYKEYIALRQQYPKDTFVLCNAKNYKIPVPTVAEPVPIRSFCVPDLGAGIVTKFTANIFQGIRPLSDVEIAADSHFFPWAKKYVKAAIGEFGVTVERVVTFRPFDHLGTLPNYARYLMFGDGKSGETHMTNLQTAALVTSPFEPQVFGPDYDHVMSLAKRPAWLKQDAMLEAGIVVTTPIVRLTDPDTGQPTIPKKSPFSEGSEIEVLYRGVVPARTVISGATYLYCTAVCNSPRFFVKSPPYNNYLNSLPAVDEVCEFSMMPKRYWAFPPEEDEECDEELENE